MKGKGRINENLMRIKVRKKIVRKMGGTVWEGKDGNCYTSKRRREI